MGNAYIQKQQFRAHTSSLWFMKKFRRILLVDDDETSNFLTQLVIEEMNLASEVIVKVDGASALKFLWANCLVSGCVVGRVVRT